MESEAGNRSVGTGVVPVQGIGGVERLQALDEQVSEAVRRFVEGKRNPNTRDAYRRDVEDFADWCREEGGVIFTASRSAVERYVTYLETKRGASAATIARRLSGLSAFFERLIDEGVLERNPVARVDRPKVSSESPTLGLEKEHLRALLDVARSRSDRDLALVGLLALSGLRVSEAVGLDVTDLSVQRGHHVVTITRKGGEKATVTVAPPVVPVLQAVIGDRVSGPIFLNGKGARLSRTQATNSVTAMSRKAGIDGKITAHSLRHTYVTLSLDVDVPIRDIAAAAGHKDVRTTMRYDRARHSLDRSPTYPLTAHLGWE